MRFMLREFSRGLRVYVVLVGLIAASWLGLISLEMRLDAWPHLLFFFLVLIVAEVVPVGLSPEPSTGFAASVDMAGIILFGTAPAAWVCLLGRSVAALVLRESAWANPYPKDVSFYKIAHAILAVQVAGSVYLASGGGLLLRGASPQPIAIAIMALAYFATYWGLAALAYSLRYRTPYAPQREARDWMRALVTIPVALIFAIPYSKMQVGLSGVLLFVLFLLLVMYASRLFVDMKAVYWGTVRALMKPIENKDKFGQGHGDRVALYAVAIARKLMLPEAQVTVLHWAGFLHDIGSVGIHERILQREGPLSVEEFSAVMQHPEKGYQMLREIPFLKQTASAIRFHHERYDGKGYPRGLKGEEIPLDARILAVAETYGALISQRSYRQPFRPEDARREVEALAGTALDPAVVRGFLEVWNNEMRWGQVVFHRHYRLDANGLSGGRQALVTRGNAYKAD